MPVLLLEKNGAVSAGIYKNIFAANNRCAVFEVRSWDHAQMYARRVAADPNKWVIVRGHLDEGPEVAFPGARYIAAQEVSTPEGAKKAFGDFLRPEPLPWWGFRVQVQSEEPKLAKQNRAQRRRRK